ncbi:MAG: MBL fold metallo-hydrolase [Dehalococcoidales bacterium]|nr:MBL fold metallo-hydrolase [Dehalococcoidales bacterium]
MRVKWLGHASFLITSDDGIKIITDPYTTGGDLSYAGITETADIVTVSHDHYDHNNVSSVRGDPEVVRVGTAEVKGISFKGISSCHDEKGGRLRGGNTMFYFTVSGVRVCHLGDLGHRLSDKQAAEIGPVDVLLIPVGGNFTIDAGYATSVCNRLKPRVVIPMHYRNERCAFPVAGVDEFLKGKTNVSRPDASEVEFNAGDLPAITRIIVLEPAL